MVEIAGLDVGWHERIPLVPQQKGLLLGIPCSGMDLVQVITLVDSIGEN